MSKKMTAKEYMRQVEKLDKLIANKLIEIEQWRSVATGISSFSEGERVQSSRKPQKMADATVEYITLQKENDNNIEKLYKKKKEIIGVIEQLPIAEYDLLHQRYIQQKSLYEIAEEKNISYAWATKLHGIALKHVQEIIDEEEK